MYCYSIFFYTQNIRVFLCVCMSIMYYYLYIYGEKYIRNYT